MSGAEEEKWIGQTIADKYVIRDVIDSGGVAIVFRAEHAAVSRNVAIKVLLEHSAERDDFRARFEREARALAALSHPNIVSMIDFGFVDESPYLVMELLEGRTLGGLIDAETQVPPTRAFAITKQILRALQYAHEQGLLHRDLKPGNIFLQVLPHTADHVKMLDFGFAKFHKRTDERGAQLTTEGMVFGTPAYISPEQLLGEKATERSDLYAVAVLLYEMLSGRRPFEGTNREMLIAKRGEDPPPLGRVAPELAVSEELEAVLAHGLARDPEARTRDIETFLTELDAIPETAAVLQKGVHAAPPEMAAALAAGGQKRRVPWFLLVAAGAIIPVVLAGGLFLLAGEDPPEPAPPPAPQPAVEVAPAVEVEPSGPDPWTEDAEVAPEIEAVRQTFERGEDVPRPLNASLRYYVDHHEDDPRGHLVLGHVFAQRGMRAMAIQSYQRAAELDPIMRGDNRMLTNLVLMATQPGAGSGPARVLRSVYAEEALPAVDAALDHPDLDPRRARRLRDLRETITAP